MSAPKRTPRFIDGSTHPDTILDTNEAAQFTGEAPGTLANKRARGEGPPYVKIARNRVGYRLADLIAYTRRHRIVPGEGPDLDSAA